MTVNDEVLINVDHVSKSFTGAVGDTLLVLDDINLDLRAGEIVALLGRSGSGNRLYCARLRASSARRAARCGTAARNSTVRTRVRQWCFRHSR